MQWTDDNEQTDGDAMPRFAGLVHACLGGVTVIAGCLVICGAVFSTNADGWARLGAAGVGALTIICGGLMARKDD